jgi:hypothetical protein
MDRQMYFDDLTPYSYREPAEGVLELNVGWLETGSAFAVGEVPEGFIAALFRFCKASPRQTETRGFHVCDLCSMPRSAVPKARLDGRAIAVGFQELRAFGVDGTVYAAPTLIFHYVTEHGYRPPEAFIRAVLEGPQPGTAEYKSRLARLWPSAGPGP